MGSWSVPSGSGGRVDPGGRGHLGAIRDISHREPGVPGAGEQRRDRRDAPTVRRDVTFGAVCVAQRLARRGEQGIAVVAVVVSGVAGGSNECGRRTWEIQALAMSG